MDGLFRRKPTGTDPRARADGPALPKTLSWPHLLALGVGAIVGTGILTLIGVGADRAGPAVLVSFAIAGAICACAALAYAELATAMPAAGSAYSYSYAALGEIVAWVVGWSLILEYSLVVSTVAVGWSGYAAPLLAALGLPENWTHGPVLAGDFFPHFRLMLITPSSSWVMWTGGSFRIEQGGVNVPAIFIIAVVASLLCFGTKESARLNTVLVLVKIATLALFVAVVLPRFDAANLHPFTPFGFAKHVGPDKVARGVMAAAAIIFFAFYGFDAISTAAEEAKRPERDLAIGIVGSMLACTAIYVGVAAAAVGAVPFRGFARSPEPLALILREMGQGGVARIVAVAAVVALPTVLLGFLYGQSRIFLVMARDGFLPQGLARISRRGTPARITLLTAILVAVLAGLLPIDEIAALANAGTLIAFTAVGACLVVLRVREPELKRPFRAPAWPLVGAGAVAGCLYLFASLPAKTLGWCLGWNLVGLVVYLGYGRRGATAARLRAG